MTSSTDRYIAGYVDKDGDICLYHDLAAATGDPEELAEELRDSRCLKPKAAWQLFKLVPVDASGNPIPGPRGGETGLRPSTGRLGGSNGPSGTSAGTAAGTMTAYRDETGEIVIGHNRAISFAADITGAELHAMRDEPDTSRFRAGKIAAIDAALALLDREEATDGSQARGTCPECGYQARLKIDGKLRRHPGRMEWSPDGWSCTDPCTGTGKTPTQKDQPMGDQFTPTQWQIVWDICIHQDSTGHLPAPGGIRCSDCDYVYVADSAPQGEDKR